MKVYELDGVYVANAYPPTEDINPTHQVSTFVTYDLGGEWRNLTPPAVDWHGNPIICPEVRKGCEFGLIAEGPVHVELVWIIGECLRPILFSARYRNIMNRGKVLLYW